jgi:hypothetical protein
MGKPRTVRAFPHDPTAPIFAISYTWPKARQAQHTNIRYVRRLFAKLESSVSQLVGAAPGQEIGFLDREALGGGQDPWPDAVRDAFTRCQVMVALLTPGYPKSSWCEQEWRTFAGRRAIDRATGRLTHSKSILPVRWIPGGSMPRYISEVALFSPTNLPGLIEEHYLDDGLFGLAEAYGKEFGPVAWRLARRITDCLEQTWTEVDTVGRVNDNEADQRSSG